MFGDDLFSDLPFTRQGSRSMSPGIMDTQLHLAKTLSLPRPMCKTIGLTVTHPPEVWAEIEKEKA